MLVKGGPGQGTEPAFRQWKIKETHNDKGRLAQNCMVKIYIKCENNKTNHISVLHTLN